MKSMLFGLAFLFTATTVLAQDPPKSPRVTASGDNVEIAYGQPSKKGRQIFPGLEAYGKVWRAGANKSTDITFKKDAQFGGKSVKAGTYALFIIPGEKDFTFILNSVPAQNGASEYEKNKDKNVAEVKVARQKTASTVEKLTFSLPKGSLVFEWDDAKAVVPLTF
ncbi:DUF2911 domain-containing protein [Chitinophaga sp. GCM10012297]|uniref:DUF2911 domain-containing protein n=1 Tax=Chitinophaga chungangae TaxID=2821488 RepID=A0ABS3YGD5_9BACT|nr:DUF2911 domain-containing protein [Chitinophaga chungangae]MBO9153734.1 DUF2911 domain-containing protein [Chitinophaga chungangae]